LSSASASVLVNAEYILGRVDRRIYGQFVEHLGRCIYGGIWVGETSKLPNTRGFRNDVLEAVRALRPPIVRWPGGNFASAYHWMDGIGDRHKRPTKFDLAWGAEDPNQFGTNEFIEWCRIVGAEPYIVVNAGNGTPEEAAAWVEYTNHRGAHKYAALRRENGYPEPFEVRLWGIGNELYGDWQVGYCADARDCAKRTVEFANEMRKADPNIQLVAVGHIEPDSIEPEWNLEMIKTAGRYIDYLSVHTYIGGEQDYLELLSAPALIERNLNATYKLVESAAKRYTRGRDIKLAFDEWNVWYPEARPALLHQDTAVKDGLFTGLVLNALLRLVGKVPIACFAQTVNVLPLILTRDDGALHVNPQYLVFRMYVENTGDYSLGVSTSAPCYRSKSLGEHLPVLDASSTISEDGSALYVNLVNKDPKEPVECAIDLRAFAPTHFEHIYMSGEDIGSKNDFENPENVRIERGMRTRVDSLPVRVKLPPHSVNVLAFRAVSG
jgi:alpha-N-arabinofuranosidase